MTNGNKLGHLLSEARKEPSLVSEEEVRNLLQRKGRIKDSTFALLIQQIQGVPFMFKLSFAIATAAAVGFIAFNTNTEQIETEQVAQKHQAKLHEISEPSPGIKNANSGISQNEITETGQIKEENKPGQKPKIIKVEKNPSDGMDRIERVDEIEVSEDNAIPDNSINDNTFEPVEIKGVHFITLNTDQLEKLGIAKNSKGELKYWDNWGRINQKPVLCTLYVNGGLGIKEKNNDDYNKIYNSGISPRLITDNRGNRRVFVSDDDVPVLNRQYDEQITIEDKTGEHNTILRKKSIISHEYSDSLYPGMERNLKINKNIYLDGGDVISNPDINIDSLVDVSIKSAMADIDNNNELDVDSKQNLKSSFPKFINKDIFSKTLSKIDEKQLADMETESKFMVFSIDDSLLDKNMPDKQIITEISNEQKMISVQLEYNDNDSNQLEFNIPDSINLKKHIKMKLLPDSEYFDKIINCDDILNIEKNIEDYVKINKLIPILVPIGKVETENELIDKENFGFVLWFDPTPELLDILPEDVKNKLNNELFTLENTDDICEATAIAGEDPYLEAWRACSGAIENLKVYPNPTSGNISVEYSLSDNRKVTISVHDMFGNVVRELQAQNKISPGDYNENFMLNNLESGMYLISVQTKNGEAAVQRIVLEK
ncbi:T9SS type A sorting domain-containing protein [Bacteroidota bacterium]